MPLIEQPYLLKMVIVTERIGTALVRSENVLQSQRDVLMQLVTGDYRTCRCSISAPSTSSSILPVRCGWRRCVWRGCPACFASSRPSRPKPGCCRPTAACVSSCSSSSTSRTTPSRCWSAAICFFPAAG